MVVSARPLTLAANDNPEPHTLYLETVERAHSQLSRIFGKPAPQLCLPSVYYVSSRLSSELTRQWTASSFGALEAGRRAYIGIRLAAGTPLVPHGHRTFFEQVRDADLLHMAFGAELARSESSYFSGSNAAVRHRLLKDALMLERANNWDRDAMAAIVSELVRFSILGQC